MILTLPVSPETCRVNGYLCKASDIMWRGLDLSRATVRKQSTLMLFVLGPDEAPYDLHLDVPWEHPDDTVDDGLRYRVRPRMRRGGRWQGRRVRNVSLRQMQAGWAIDVEFAGTRHSRTQTKKSGA